jgi:predicted DNA-binding transcriptional regulator AlpA
MSTNGLSALAGDVSTQRLIDMHEAAALYGVVWRTLLRYVDMGLVPAGIKLGGSRRWVEAELRAHIAGGCKPVRQVKAK